MNIGAVTEDDLLQAFRLHEILSNLRNGETPDGEYDTFDAEKFDHLKSLHDEIAAVDSVSILRVVFGMQGIYDAGWIDKEADCLAMQIPETITDDQFLEYVRREVKRRYEDGSQRIGQDVIACVPEGIR